MVDLVGPPATINREPGQARKGAATAVDLGAGVWLAGSASTRFFPFSEVCHAQAANSCSVFYCFDAGCLYPEFFCKVAEAGCYWLILTAFWTGHPGHDTVAAFLKAY